MSSALELHTATGIVDILEGDIAMASRGPWLAHVVVDADTAASAVAPSGVVSLVMHSEAGGTDSVAFIGTVRRGNPWQGRCPLVVVGGAGGLRSELPSRDHLPGATSVDALLVAQGIATACGEELDASVSDALAGLTLDRWVRLKMTAARALSVLADSLGLQWRILSSGKLWIGRETWPIVGDAAVGLEIDEDADDGMIVTAPDTASLRPGTTVLGRRIARVTYRLEEGTRAELLFAVTGEASEPLEPIVYREVHGAKIVKQNDDGTLEIVADDARIGGLSSVPIRSGIPGAKITPSPAKITAGTERVRLAFEGGSPSRPYAVAFDEDRETDTYGVVRVGDTGDAGQLAATCAAGPVTFVYLAPGSPPSVDPLSVSLSTKASTGSAEIKIR